MNYSIGQALNKARIKFVRLDGKMQREDRDKSLNNFRKDPSCEVFLISLRAGGVGLNLTSANRVYLMEPYWNPAVEAQAMDRVHSELLYSFVTSFRPDSIDRIGPDEASRDSENDYRRFH